MPKTFTIEWGHEKKCRYSVMEGDTCARTGGSSVVKEGAGLKPGPFF